MSKICGCGFRQRVSWIRSTDTSPKPGHILKKKACSARHCVFQRGDFQPWRAQGEAGIRVELFESGLCVPCLLVGRSHKYSWGSREEEFERYNCVWGLTSYNSLKRKKNLGIHLKKISNNECRNTRDSSPGEGVVPTTSWLLWTSNGMEVFLLNLRRFCAVLKKSINHFSKFCCVISSQECACVC